MNSIFTSPSVPGFSTAEITLIVAVIGAVVTIIGWGVTAFFQWKLKDAQEATEQRRNFQANLDRQLVVYDELLTICSHAVTELTLFLDQYAGSGRQAAAPDQKVMKALTKDLRELVDRARETARVADGSGRMEDLVISVYDLTFVNVARLYEGPPEHAVDAHRQQMLEELGDEGAGLAYTNARTELRAWVEEIRRRGPPE